MKVIDFQNMADDYVCSASFDSDYDFLKICDYTISKDLEAKLFEVAPRAKDKEATVSVEWMYDNYRVIVTGARVPEDECIAFASSIEKSARASSEKMRRALRKMEFRDVRYEFRNGKDVSFIALTYDYTHYFKVRIEGKMHVIMAYAGLDEFLRTLVAPADAGFNPQDKLATSRDNSRERALTGEKLAEAMKGSAPKFSI